MPSNRPDIREKGREKRRPEPPLEAAQDPQLSAAQGVPTDVSGMDAMAIRASVVSARSRAGTRGLVSPPVAYAELDDAAVMLRVQAGDDAAFDHLVGKFRRPIISFMYRMARNQAVAEELAQETFLRVYRSRQTYAAEAKFSTWLYRIATNLAVNHARDSRNERAGVSLDESDQETGQTLDVADGTPNVEQEILRRERLVAIRRHVDELPERQRVAVLMHKYQELDYREIARVLKLSESATKSLLFRAYETLREKLKEFI
jgi:RNA polymerase sigma-70 factor (ECF subfamily)